MPPTRVGFIGLKPSTDGSLLGSWGVRGHLRSIQGLPSLYEIVAIANSTVESSQKSIEVHKLPTTTNAYGNAEDLAADPNVELVVISVEVRKHYELAMPALKHKKDVFVEWPMAASVKEAEELTKVAKENGVRTMVGLQGRYDPLVQKVREILAEGKIGKIMSSTVTACSSVLPVETWLKDLEFYLDFNSGGNEYTIFMGHFLDSFTYLLGDFASVHGLLASQYPTVIIIDPATGQIVNPAYPKTAPEHIFITGTLESSAVASLAFRKPKSAADRVGFRWYITGTEGEIAITTEEGSWQGGGIREKRKISLKVGKADSVDVGFGKDDTTLAEKVAFPATNTARQYEAFAARDGEVITFEDALRNHRLLQRIANSSGWEMM
ncbi:Uncharacterized protein BP5553_07605 [Venustampulla echinocandica]|uniref:Uncharacterized protein n=1 Tax=Venustampulla echinocandica TaxID=2656787 RepID=A0A370TGZ7_9HELO|nr:Uncharacterized protein BP5553_07605 [Venustampulla echinocandica]RDL34477.1 Uncharacterized protein BP5553_07605 [Venustampulla echinocandica]